LNNGSTIQDRSIAFIARAVTDRADELRNSKISNASLSEFKTSIRSLVKLANSKLLRDFPIEVVDTPIDNIEYETNSAYFPDLKFSKMKRFVIESFEEAERVFGDGLCINAIRVLVNYCNIVVFARFDYGLEIKQKKLDDCDSSERSVETSTHMVIGDDSNG
jgi:hypothetical protein